jgi:hypothetical protein
MEPTSWTRSSANAGWRFLFQGLNFIIHRPGLWFMVSGFIIHQNVMGGTWTPLVQTAPEGINTMLLLSDGRVMAAGADSGNGWYLLTPDSTGSYANGTWSTVAAMHDTRLYFSSDVLTNGSVFVAGGEYGTGTNSAEVYDPVSNTWTVTPSAGQYAFYDSISKILPSGNVLVSPVAPAIYGGTVIYNPGLNAWSAGPTLVRSGYQDEASWVKLPDDSILTIDPFGINTERYIPASNQWINDAIVPVAIYDPYGSEMGAAFLLPDGRAIFLGATGNTAIYTPSGDTSMGSWQAGPVMPNNQGTPDAPAAMMVNGKILCAVSPAPISGNVFQSPTSFYEFDPVANAFTQVNGPTGYTFDSPSYALRMLDLPDGSVLLSLSDSQLYIYRPIGPSLAVGKPAIISITTNSSGLFHLTGTLLNGISEGAAYGDDAQMDSNYPLIRMTNSVNGTVYYMRTFNWSSTGVMTGDAIVSTEFAPPAGLPLADYSLVVSANGNSSDPVPFLFSLSPPVVTSQPQNQTTTSGSSVFFSVAAAGAPLSYFWLQNGMFINGATHSTYTATNVPLSDSGSQFSCLVSNVNSTTLSSAAILTVLPGLLPVITVQPANRIVSAGNSATFSLTFTSTVPGICFWKSNDFFISDATNSFYTANNVQQFNSGDQFSCLVSNAFGSAQSSNAILTVTPPSLVQNGGFEAGSFTNWTQSGNVSFTAVISGISSYVHSGNYGVKLGPSGSLGYLSQTLTTTQGQSYLLSFWLNNPWNSPVPNKFTASWNGSVIFAGTNFLTFSWTNLQFIVAAAAGGNSVLQFGFQNDPGYFGLDDISMTSVPPAIFSRPITTTNSISFSWSAMSNLVYQVQYTTNLTPANWINLGGPITATDDTAGATDAPAGDSQRFYRLIVLP